MDEVLTGLESSGIRALYMLRKERSGPSRVLALRLDALRSLDGRSKHQLELRGASS